MTREKALAFLKRVQREEPYIQATFDASRAKEDGHGYRVHLRLACRELSVNYPSQWESIKQAWQWLLHPEQEEEPARAQLPHIERNTRPRCLVDGIVMAIYRKKGTYNYWMGTWWCEGKQHYRSFGKTDPRTLYPIVAVESQEREGIAV